MHAHQCAVGEFQLWLEAQLLHPTPPPLPPPYLTLDVFQWGQLRIFPSPKWAKPLTRMGGGGYSY